jgi:hypothetical protein
VPALVVPGDRLWAHPTFGGGCWQVLAYVDAHPEVLGLSSMAMLYEADPGGPALLPECALCGSRQNVNHNTPLVL